MQETWIRSLGQEYSLENGMTNHSRILTWRIPWTEEPGRLQSMGSHRVRPRYHKIHPSKGWMVKHLSTTQKTRVQFLGWEDLLEKEMATHSSTLAWKIPWTEEPGRLQSMRSQRVGHN